MPSVQDVKIVIYASIDNATKRFTEIEKLMNYINCSDDIKRNANVVRCIISMREILSPFPVSGEYQPPMLAPPPESNKDLCTLFDFFKKMHYALWEIRTKLFSISEHSKYISSSDEAMVVVRTIKSLNDVLVPVSDQIRDLLSLNTQLSNLSV